MRITNLAGPQSNTYSSNVYLVRGDYNGMEDVNTLIDVGNDPGVIETIATISTGLAKRSVEQVVLTHGHFDHVGLLPAIRRLFDPVVYAHSPFVGAHHIVRNGDLLRCGDRDFEVIHVPGHSQDSICLYCQEDGVLFAGDTPLMVRSADGTYEEGFIQALQYICRKDVRAIYFGHGDPLLTNCNARLNATLRNVRARSGIPGRNSAPGPRNRC